MSGDLPNPKIVEFLEPVDKLLHVMEEPPDYFTDIFAPAYIGARKVCAEFMLSEKIPDPDTNDDIAEINKVLSDMYAELSAPAAGEEPDLNFEFMLLDDDKNDKNIERLRKIRESLEKKLKPLEAPAGEKPKISTKVASNIDDMQKVVENFNLKDPLKTNVSKAAAEKGLSPGQLDRILQRILPKSSVPAASDYLSLEKTIIKAIDKQHNRNVSLESSGLTAESIKAVNEFMVKGDIATTKLNTVVQAMKEYFIPADNKIDVQAAVNAYVAKKVVHQSGYGDILKVAHDLRDSIGANSQHCIAATDLLVHLRNNNKLMNDNKISQPQPNIMEVLKAVTELNITSAVKEWGGDQEQLKQIVEKLKVMRSEDAAAKEAELAANKSAATVVPVVGGAKKAG